ncbi:MULTISPECIES: hypothetical protein [Mycolicibacterium]|uniref:hypothetical protein n=1 Tax=Mycolicibacterium TaxID=1866885 RepID=UPI001E44D74D|nr:hypothetical protein [Mycolicibacterium mageritense]GJJ20504.1 hypothetical protein MTY414_41770 [Mycolicibacterium mageritense]
MTDATPDPAAPLRGVAVGGLTATLAAVAHGAAGGALPGGAMTAQLAVLAVTLGVLAATLTRADRTIVLWGLLGVGQVLGHALLATADHAHSAAPGAGMTLAHLAAVTVGAMLIAGGSRLCAAVSHAVRAAVPVEQPLPIPATIVSRDSAGPLHSVLFLISSVSHRGPPVGVRA